MIKDKEHCKKSWIQGRSRGFTLVELLVVIAVISLLTALTIPVLQSSREKGQQAVCRGNLKQLGAATLLFVGEHNGIYPSYDLFSGGARLWFQALDQGYLGDAKGDVFRCPKNKDHQFHWNSLSYGYNSNMGYYRGDGSYSHLKVRLSELGQASLTILLADGEVLQPTYSSYMNGEWRTVGRIHRGGANIAWSDGHVEWRLQESVTPEGRNAANRTDEWKIMWGIR